MMAWEEVVRRCGLLGGDMSVSLPLIFFAIALVYSMAGFGGGSSYIAILTVSEVPLSSIPVMALACNLIVSGQGSLVVRQAGYLEGALLGPLLLGSIPAAFLGGAWRMDAGLFLWFLASSLTLAGIALMVPVPSPGTVTRSIPFKWLLVLGVCLGALAGVSGIGGGIFLAPALHLARAGKAQSIAGASSLFIAMNSLAGLLGQLTKGVVIFGYIPTYLLVLCPAAVWLGGLLGSTMLAGRIAPGTIRFLTGGLVCLAGLRLWMRLIHESD